MGLLNLSYRRPVYVRRQLSRSNTPSTASVQEIENSNNSLKLGRSGTPPGIPQALSFDRIMDGGTCPPCTLRDFMNYLIYIELAAENLQFFLWYRDYNKRFQVATTADIALAPEWTQVMEDEAMANIQKEHVEKQRKEYKASAAIFKGTDFENSSEKPALPDTPNPFSTPPLSPDTAELAPSEYTSSNTQTYRSQASEAFAAAGIKAPFTIQPYREEIDRVIATYIMDDAPRQLNLSGREQKVVLTALSYTTHPSAFRLIVKTIESSLRRQAHPNFIRWSICNGNPARVGFARFLGVATILLGLVTCVVLALSDVGRGWRALGGIGFFIGIATLMSGYKGMCVVLHGLHHRHIRPWELFVTDEYLEELGKKSFESFGTSNSYEEEPWVIKYEKRNLVRKIFDREVWIQEPALRQIQDTIALQSVLCALVISAILVIVFVFVPTGGFF